MNGRRSGLSRFVGAGLLVGTIGCGDGDGAGPGGDEPRIPTTSTLASLERASDCDDLLTRIQNDAIAKLKMSVERARAQAAIRLAAGGGGVPNLDAGIGGARDAGSVVGPPIPSAGGEGTGSARDEDTSAPPTSSSGTNTQVADVDEADFVKVVESGRGIFLLHGNTLRKLRSWPAAETALTGEPLVIEGEPSEMFVTDAGKAVVFSSVAGHATGWDAGAPDIAFDQPAGCTPGGCGGYARSGMLKITVANVAGAVPVVERELYYEGSYVSSRRYAGQGADVVRAIVQSNSKYAGLFEPTIDWVDAWGRPYDQAQIDSQLAEWEARTTDSIRDTELEDWLPTAHEKKSGAVTALAPRCGDYYVPVAGLSDYGLTQVVSLDVARPTSEVFGITILGATSTVYSSADRLVLAQPDYRWGGQIDFGFSSAQQTALHVFGLSGESTSYVASGWVPGQLPLRNPQFGIDVAADGTVRLATTGFVRDQPSAERTSAAFWMQHTENYVLTARVTGSTLAVVGKTPRLGHEGESLYSARFVGDRAYVVTFRQTDPLIVVDLANAAAPAVLGELEIPGFSEYVHPLDQNHLVTVGQSASRGIQLQLFDVSDPRNLPPPKVYDFGSSSSTAVSYQHKAFTYFDGMLAIPLSSYGYGIGYGYRSTLELVRVDLSQGFTHVGAIDHSRLYADNGAGVRCGRCTELGCFDYACSYVPEVRRGHFVKGDTGTFVYSFSHAGVLVHDLASLAQPVASVGLPAPTFGGVHPGGVDAGSPIARDGGMSVGRDGGVDGGSAMPAEADAGVDVMP